MAISYGYVQCVNNHQSARKIQEIATSLRSSQ